jgi:SNF2 family DNA or RNA helicase
MKEKSELYKFHWKYIVVDEGHKLKNSQSKFAGTLGQTYQSENRLLLTGTPL